MNTILLDESDDIVSVLDRVGWAGETQVLLLLPEDGGLFRAGLDLVRLRRFADRQRIEIGLVTADVNVVRQARALGIPTFATVRAAKNGRSGWVRGRRRNEIVGLPTIGERYPKWRQRIRIRPADREEASRRLTPASFRRRWVVRYTAVFFFCITLSLLYVMFVTTVPGATLTLKPDVLVLSVAPQITADPSIDRINYAQNQLPARTLLTTVTWQSDVATTGTVDVPNAPARGVVLFVNQLEQEVIIPAGTRVSTSDGETILFQTVEEITLANVVGSTAEVDVIAVEPGPAGNVGANQINRVEGLLATQVDVRNLEPLEGGGSRPELAVSQADADRLRAQVIQFLQALALSEMEAELTEQEFLTRDSLRITRIFSETYSHAVGEQTPRLTLELRVELQGTAVNTTQASSLAYEALIQTVPDQHTLVPESIQFTSGDVVGSDDAGRVTFIMNADAVAAVEIPVPPYLEIIAGHPAAEAMAFLDGQLPLRETPEIAVWPVWFDRVPYTPTRISTVIVTGDRR